MYSVETNVGRLVELRIEAPFSSADLEPFKSLVRKVLARAPGGKAIVCCDLREATVFTQDVANGLIDLMRGDNPRIERNGLLVTGNAVFTMQIERLVRNAGSPNRRVFRLVVPCVAWLDELLLPIEREQLRTFLKM